MPHPKLYEHAQNVTAALSERLGHARMDKPEMLVIGGSGIGGHIKVLMEVQLTIPYEDLAPDLPVITDKVEGHAGELVFGTLNGVRVMLMNGRPVHGYQLVSDEEIWKCVVLHAVAKLLGVRAAVITSAVGAINNGFRVCDLMVCTGLIRISGSSVLRGPVCPELIRKKFPDFTELYPSVMRAALQDAAPLNMLLRSGVVGCSVGYSYETPAEIQALAAMGADAASMSMHNCTEALCAMDVPLLGICAVSNAAAGVTLGGQTSPEPLQHSDVVERSAVFGRAAAQLIHDAVPGLLKSADIVSARWRGES